MMYSPHLLLTMPIPLWMPVMTGATAAMVAMGMIGLIWLRQDMNALRQDMNTLRQDMNALRQDMNARFDRLEADMKELRDLIMKALVRDSVTAP